MKYGTGRGKCTGNNIGAIKIKLYRPDMPCLEKIKCIVKYLNNT